MTDIDVGQISEALNDKADRDLNNVTPPYLQKRYVSNGIVIEIWSDGYCVQKGIASHSQGDNAKGTVTFARAYKDTDYIFLSVPKGTMAGTAFIIGTFDATTTSIGVSWDGASRDPGQFYWEASGYTN